MFTAADKKRRNLDEATLRDYLRRILHSTEGKPDPVDAVLGLYAQTPEGQVRTPGQVWSAVLGDKVFRFPAVQLADRNVEIGGSAWLYRFDWKPRWLTERLGACHSIELPFVFGSLREPLPRWLLMARLEDQVLSEKMQDAWLAFAKSGDPRSEDNPSWPAYRPQTGDAYVWGGCDDLSPALPEAERRFWAGQDDF